MTIREITFSQGKVCDLCDEVKNGTFHVIDGDKPTKLAVCWDCTRNNPDYSNITRDYYKAKDESETKAWRKANLSAKSKRMSDLVNKLETTLASLTLEESLELNHLQQEYIEITADYDSDHLYELWMDEFDDPKIWVWVPRDEWEEENLDLYLDHFN